MKMWMMIRGRDGKKGDPGDPGRPGPPGHRAPSLHNLLSNLSYALSGHTGFQKALTYNHDLKVLLVEVT